MSAVYVDSIKDKSNTKTLATLSSSAVTLHSDATFPAGHIIQHKFKSLGTAGAHRTHELSTSWTKINLTADLEITGFSATENNLLYISVSGLCHEVYDDATYQTFVGVSTSGTSPTSTTLIAGTGLYFDFEHGYSSVQCWNWVYTVPASFTSKTLSVITRMQTGWSDSGANHWTIRKQENDASLASQAILSVMEVQA